MLDNCFCSVIVPIIEVPDCVLHGKEQDCFFCTIKCHAPQALCVKPYHRHKVGCPNYGNKPDCPPLAPLYGTVFDLGADNFALGVSVDIQMHIETMRERHPSWSEYQLRNPLYWQGSIRKLLKKRVHAFINEKPLYRATLRPEAMGVNVVKTLENVGKRLEWYPSTIITKIALLGIPVSDQYNNILFF